MLRVDLLRHGEPEGGQRYRGWLDDPLTPAGWEAMERVWRRLAGEVEHIVSSPLRRCAEPARAWASERGLPLTVDRRVAELRYGAWEGLTAEAIRERDGELLERWRRDPRGLRPPGGESPEELWERVGAWWRETVARFPAGRLLVVTHSGVLRTLLAQVLGGDLAASRRFRVPYACWARLCVEEGQVLLEGYGAPR